jgi:hypothetical protein
VEAHGGAGRASGLTEQQSSSNLRVPDDLLVAREMIPQSGRRAPLRWPPSCAPVDTKELPVLPANAL